MTMSGTATADIAQLDRERVVLSKEVERLDEELAALVHDVPADTHAVALASEVKRVFKARLSEVTREEGRLVGDEWSG
jgi:hypothetical protein